MLQVVGQVTHRPYHRYLAVQKCVFFPQYIIQSEKFQPIVWKGSYCDSACNSVEFCLTEGSVQALACYIWTSGSGGRQPVPAAPWCCPSVLHLRSDSPDHRAPSPAYREGRERGISGKVKAKEKNQWRQIRNMWEKKNNKTRNDAAILSPDIGSDSQQTKAVVN